MVYIVLYSLTKVYYVFATKLYYVFATKLYYVFATKLYFIFLCMVIKHTLCDHDTTHQTLV